jgi:hypothetical protein
VRTVVVVERQHSIEAERWRAKILDHEGDRSVDMRVVMHCAKQCTLSRKRISVTQALEHAEEIEAQQNPEAH